MGRAPIKLLRLSGMPILQQLNLEEALLRATTSNWMLINDGAADCAVVMGISGKPHELLHTEEVQRQHVPVIRRFTGGGTVVVGGDTLFTALIMQAEQLPHVEPYPVPIMKWSEGFFSPVFSPLGDFRLAEHDYAFGGLKFGGNAQAITGRRWVHHSSLLWDYRPERMALLRPPPKQPQYREGRDHAAFLTRLREWAPSRSLLLDALAQAAASRFDVEEVRVEEAAAALGGTYLRGNKVVDLAAEEQQRHRRQQLQQQQRQHQQQPP